MMTPETTPARVADSAWTSLGHGARWLALVPFAIVVVAMLGTEAPLRGAVVGWSLASFAAAALLVSRLAGPGVRTLWAWLVLALFTLGYLLQSVLALSLGGDPAALERGIGSDMTWVTPAVVVDAFVWIAQSAVVAFLTTTVALELLARAAAAPDRSSADRVAPRSIWWLIAACAGASLVFAWLRFVLDIGVLGRETVHLPLRLDTGDLPQPEPPPSGALPLRAVGRGASRAVPSDDRRRRGVRRPSGRRQPALDQQGRPHLVRPAGALPLDLRSAADATAARLRRYDAGAGDRRLSLLHRAAPGARPGTGRRDRRRRRPLDLERTGCTRPGTRS